MVIESMLQNEMIKILHNQLLQIVSQVVGVYSIRTFSGCPPFLYNVIVTADS